MSTDDERPEASGVAPVPQTRAEMRAAREAAEAAAAAAASAAQKPDREPWVAEPVDAPAPAPAEEPRTEALRQAQGPSGEELVDAPAAADRPARRSSYEAPASDEADAPSSPRFARRSGTAEPKEPKPAKPAKEPKPAKPPRAKREAPATDSDAANPSRRFGLALAAVLGILVLVGAGFGVVSLTQGPRISEVQVDPEQAINASGSRVILTANQALAAIDPAQVTVEPSVPFTVDAAGRGIGIRFTVPLDDDTKYTVTVADAVGAGGGPKSDLTTSFTTPGSSIFLLNRDADGDDKIFDTVDLSGEQAVPVFAADKINDFRATSTQLVVTVEEDDGSHIYVMDRDGKNQRELPLPGEGYVGAIQVSERGGLVGYSYSDRELSDTEGRASVLVTQSLNDSNDEPQIIEVGDAEASIFAWQFVPDSAAVLFIDFDGALSLVDRSSDAGVQSLGLAANIQGISRGTYTAIVERLDGTVVELNLADGSEQPLAASDPDYGIASTITPFPGGTLRHIVARDENGIPTGQAIIRVADDGTATTLVEVASTESILQACASPSGQYAAVVIAPDMTKNPYDEMLLPLPQNMETHLLDLRTGEELVALTGFDASWCQTAPRF